MFFNIINDQDIIHMNNIGYPIHVVLLPEIFHLFLEILKNVSDKN